MAGLAGLCCNAGKGCPSRPTPEPWIFPPVVGELGERSHPRETWHVWELVQEGSAA